MNVVYSSPAAWKLIVVWSCERGLCLGSVLGVCDLTGRVLSHGTSTASSFTLPNSLPWHPVTYRACRDSLFLGRRQARGIGGEVAGWGEGQGRAHGHG